MKTEKYEDTAVKTRLKKEKFESIPGAKGRGCHSMYSLAEYHDLWLIVPMYGHTWAHNSNMPRECSQLMTLANS